MGSFEEKNSFRIYTIRASKCLYPGQGRYFGVYTVTTYGLPKLSNLNTLLKISKGTLHVLQVTTMHLNTLMVRVSFILMLVDKNVVIPSEKSLWNAPCKNEIVKNTLFSKLNFKTNALIKHGKSIVFVHSIAF